MSFNLTLKDKVVLLVAKRNSGKSYLLRYLVRLQAKDFDKIYVICPTEIINKFYSKDNFIPQNQIFDSYDESWVDALIKKMTNLNTDKVDAEKKRVLLILDDVVADTRFAYSESFKKLIVRGRHMGISLILTTQYINLLPPVSRVNTDFLIIGQLNNQSLQICADQFSNGISRKEFIELHKDNTKDFNFLIISQSSSKTNTINEIYGSIKTPATEFINL